MKKLLSPIAFLLASVALYAQADSIQTEKKSKSYIVTVSTNDGRTIKGLLGSPNDSQLVLIRSLKAAQVPSSVNNQMQIPAENIQSFTVKRKNAGLRGALIGFGIGAVTGIVAGLVSGDDELVPYPDPANDIFGLGTFSAGMSNMFAMTAGQKAVAYGAGLGCSGAIIGAIIGAVAKKKFTIGGKKEIFRDLQAELMTKLVQK
ncbi:MAG TPA: hypothetical protein VIZ28_16815 [Chitinophagaceae bacterium]